MNADTKATLEQIVRAIVESEQVLSAVAEFTGLDSLKIVSVSKELLPTLRDTGPDEAAAYDAARAEAEAKTDPAPPVLVQVKRTGLGGT